MERRRGDHPGSGRAILRFIRASASSLALRLGRRSSRRTGAPGVCPGRHQVLARELRHRGDDQPAAKSDDRCGGRESGAIKPRRRWYAGRKRLVVCGRALGRVRADLACAAPGPSAALGSTIASRYCSSAATEADGPAARLDSLSVHLSPAASPASRWPRFGCRSASTISSLAVRHLRRRQRLFYLLSDDNQSDKQRTLLLVPRTRLRFQTWRSRKDQAARLRLRSAAAARQSATRSRPAAL
jgi:hypothetical protein